MGLHSNRSCFTVCIYIKKKQCWIFLCSAQKLPGLGFVKMKSCLKIPDLVTTNTQLVEVSSTVMLTTVDLKNSQPCRLPLHSTDPLPPRDLESGHKRVMWTWRHVMLKCHNGMNGMFKCQRISIWPVEWLVGYGNHMQYNTLMFTFCNKKCTNNYQVL